MQGHGHPPEPGGFPGQRLTGARAGAQLFKYILGLAGAVAAGVGINLALTSLDSLTPEVVWIITGVGGVFVGLVVQRLERLGHFLLGATGGLLVANTAFQIVMEHLHGGWSHRHAKVLHISVTVGVSCAAGLLLVYLEKPFKTVLTSLTGGYLFIAGLDHFLWRLHFEGDEGGSFWPEKFFAKPAEFTCDGHESCYTLLGGWGVLFLTGIGFQSVYSHKPAAPRTPAQEGYSLLIAASPAPPSSGGRASPGKSTGKKNKKAAKKKKNRRGVDSLLP